MLPSPHVPATSPNWPGKSEELKPLGEGAGSVKHPPQLTLGSARRAQVGAQMIPNERLSSAAAINHRYCYKDKDDEQNRNGSPPGRATQ